MDLRTVPMPWACEPAQKDLRDMELALSLWCPEEHRERMRFAVTESAAIDWGGAEPAGRRQGLVLSRQAPVRTRACQCPRGGQVMWYQVCFTPAPAQPAQ